MDEEDGDVRVREEGAMGSKGTEIDFKTRTRDKARDRAFLSRCCYGQVEIPQGHPPDWPNHAVNGLDTEADGRRYP